MTDLEKRKDIAFRNFVHEIESLSTVYSPVAREIPERAHGFWRSAIKGFSLAQAKQVIAEWPLTNNKMMLPADLTRELNRRRSDAIEEHAEKVRQDDNKPLPAFPNEKFRDTIIAMNRILNTEARDATRWAKRLMCLEAFGFDLCLYSKKSWRRALNFPDDYRFEDMPGLPVHDMKRCYVPAPDNVPHNLHAKFLFFYEQVIGSYAVTEGAEMTVFRLMDKYDDNYWINYPKDLEKGKA